MSRVGVPALTFLDWMIKHELLNKKSPRDIYLLLFEGNEPLISEFLSDNQTIAFTKLSLANHIELPSIQAFYHYYRESVAPGWTDLKDCDIWVDFGGKQICDYSDLKLSQDSVWIQSPLLQMDHHYRLTDSTSKTAILYGDIYHTEFKNFYNQLSQLSSDEFDFVLRFKPVEGTNKVHLSGYGVELAVKNTEYQTTDDRKINGEDQAVSEDVDYNDSMDILGEKNPIVQKLSKTEIEDISLRAIHFASSSVKPFDTLVKLTQNFPKYAHLLLTKPTKPSIFQLSTTMIQTLLGDEPLLLLNGMNIDLSNLNPFGIIRKMREEYTILKQLQSLGLNFKDGVDLLSSPLGELTSGDGWGDIFYSKTNLTIWINDLEKDDRYSDFPKSLSSLLQPSYSQFKFVRKNIFSAQFVVKFTNPLVVSQLLRIFQIVEQGIPIRFGFIPLLETDGNEEPSFLIAKSLYYIKENGFNMVEYLQKLVQNHSGESIASSVIKSTFAQIYGKELDSVDISKRLPLRLMNYAKNLGIRGDGAIFFNGKYSPMSNNWSQDLLEVYFAIVNYLAKSVGMGIIGDSDDIFDHFLSMKNVYHTRNPSIFTDTDTNVRTINLADIQDVIRSLYWITGNDEQKSISIIIVPSFESEIGLETTQNGLDAIMNIHAARLTIVDGSKKGFKNMVKYLQSNKPNISDIKNHIISEAKVHDPVDFGTERIMNTVPVKQGNTYIIINGRLVGPLTSAFTKKDFEALVAYELKKRVSNVAKHIKSILSKFSVEMNTSDVILVASSILTTALSPTLQDPKRNERINTVQFDNYKSSELYFSHGNPNSAPLQFTAAIQPLSDIGQKILSILDRFSKIEGVSIEIFALGLTFPNTEKLPLNRFYRFEFETNPSFKPNGEMVSYSVHFDGIPKDATLTLGMDVPGSWLVRPERSPYDLDNIKLSKIPASSNLEAEFLLQSILVEGHASDSKTNGPPRGLQFVLGTSTKKSLVDTITMANLGYLQFKATPGVWKLSVREGRSEEVYRIKKVNQVSDSNDIIVDSFEGITIYPLVSKNPGMDEEDVLAENSKGDNPKEGEGIWSQLKSKLFQTQKTASTNTTINVFSVASGHLYERFLAIMMLSVKQQTKNPLKFWLIENFLSPSFLKFVPVLAKAFDFEYELVTYKWPHWLRKQTEKQRIIWGYKILFLDVLFPLKLDKVIFVDADQVVRADLLELVNMDLKGAVYGYTPFCQSNEREETKGFRFWKDGYWKSHLKGRAYHISALYVVDLVKFRAVAAGDRLRQNYHMLSADPHSLANLDQDLPNSMIHEIPMFSLPQDWLWCETWCTDASLKTAKTIDLCNNPLTKEPKLERAKRILPEWETLDQQVAKVQRAFENEETKKETQRDRDEL